MSAARLLPLLVALSCSSAVVQYDAVAEPFAGANRRQDAAALVEVFRQENAQRGRPRMALLWNRSFSDDVATEYTDFVRDQSKDTNSSTKEANATSTEFGSASLQMDDSTSTRAAEHTEGSRREQEAPRARPPERLDWQLESAFTQQLNVAGARILDRAVLMRTLNDGRSAGDRADLQAIEAQALLGKSDLILEVLLARDATVATGVVFRVSIKDLVSGDLIASYVTAATPRGAGRGSYRAGPQGFEYVPHEPSVREIGSELALQAMQHLIAHWEREP